MEDKKIAMISQPMAGLTDFEINDTRNRAKHVLDERGFNVIETLYSDYYYNPTYLHNLGVVHIPLYLLSKILEDMSQCHAVYFCKGWENARGCKIEHEVAVAYGLEIIYE